MVTLSMTIFGCDSKREAASEDDQASRVSTPSRATEAPTETLPPSVSPGEVAKSFDRDRAIEQAQKQIAGGDLAAAAKTLRQVLLVQPDDAETLFRLSHVESGLGNFEEACALLEAIPPEHPEAGLPSLGRSADLCLQLGRYQDAEQRYKRIVSRVPRFAVAHRQLAYLFNRQGRRHEAAKHIRVLCELGDVQQDELFSLMVLGHATYQDPELPSPPGSRPYWPIGPAANARKLYTDYRFVEAADLLHDHVAAGAAAPSIVAFYGRLAAESQDDERFDWWLSQTTKATREYSEYWAAVGSHLAAKRRFPEAVRALAEALERDPTDAPSMQRLNEALLALGRDQEAEAWAERYATIRETTLASNRIGQTASPNPKDYLTVVHGLQKLERPLEAVMWEIASAYHRQLSPERVQELAARRQQVAESSTRFPTPPALLCGLDKQAFPLPDLPVPSESGFERKTARSTLAISPRFRNVADEIGLNHAYQIAAAPQQDQFALYQTLGGGACVIDFDLDGAGDLYLPQGAADPPEFQSDQSNLMLRNCAGLLREVTVPSQLTETRYSIGATAGDWNQDGFPDLLVGNLGSLRLLTNNGDGTFALTADWRPEQQGVVPSSLAIADVSGDAIPDLTELRYVADPSMSQRPQLDADGNVLNVAFAEYEPGLDRIHVSDGAGGFSVQHFDDSVSARSTGLGVVIADFDGAAGNEVFVGNDIRANQFWVRRAGGEFADLATISGCAFGNGGVRTASMGIAVGDFDRSGTPDIHVTNFFMEPVSFFLNQQGAFEDLAVRYDLATPSRMVLGFGSQALDYDNDGDADLVVTNGAIERPANPQEPFQQEPQLFANVGHRFELSKVSDASGYFAGRYLGRGLARLDFNRDGRSDFLVTHLGTPTALLINETPTDHHWLQVSLVGSKSERDGIGATVEVKAGGESWVQFVTAGDGYLAHNSAVLGFGLGPVSRIDEVVVRWPDGEHESFTITGVDRHVLLVEGSGEVFQYRD